MIFKIITVLVFLLSSTSANPSYMNSLQTCMVTDCSFKISNSEYPQGLMECIQNNMECVDFIEGVFQDMCKTSSCLQVCREYFSSSDQECNQKCMDTNSEDIQESCTQEAKAAAEGRDTHILDKNNDGDDDNDDILWIVVYTLIGLVSGMAIAGFICCYLKKKQREKKQQQQQVNPNKAQNNQMNNQQKDSQSQEIALGYPAHDNIFDENNVYFVGDFQKLQSIPSSQGSHTLIKQSSLISTVSQTAPAQQVLIHQSSLPDHLQKYIKNNIPIKNAVIGDDQDNYNQQQFMIPQGTKL